MSELDVLLHMVVPLPKQPTHPALVPVRRPIYELEYKCHISGAGAGAGEEVGVECYNVPMHDCTEYAHKVHQHLH